MSKKIKIIVFIIIILMIIPLYKYSEKVNDIAQNRDNKTRNKKLDVTIIDKNNMMETLYEDPEREEYVKVDAILGGQYYKDVGIRTKGYSTYSYLKRTKSKQYSYKIKLDYMNLEQKYERNNRISPKYTCYGPNKNTRIYNVWSV